MINFTLTVVLPVHLELDSCSTHFELVSHTALIHPFPFLRFLSYIPDSFMNNCYCYIPGSVGPMCPCLVKGVYMIRITGADRDGAKMVVLSGNDADGEKVWRVAIHDPY